MPAKRKQRVSGGKTGVSGGKTGVSDAFYPDLGVASNGRVNRQAASDDPAPRAASNHTLRPAGAPALPGELTMTTPVETLDQVIDA